MRWLVVVIVLWCARGMAASLPLDLQPGEQVLFVAPHPDDETIGAGGLIHQLRRAGTRVDVLYLTNGDGWDWAAQLAAGGRVPTDGDYVALGRTRRREALGAAGILGLGPDALQFLGFPDDGLDALLTRAWSGKPFVSPHTSAQSVPYQDAYDPRALYTGEALTATIARVLRATRPALVLMPHPNDTHPDHAAAARFVMRALASVRGQGVMPRKTRILTYLIHHADWPAMALAPAAPMLPPSRRQVPATRWTVVPLSDEDRTAQAAALEQHRTQLAASPDFLRNFVRSTELFGRPQSKALLALAPAP